MTSLPIEPVPPRPSSETRWPSLLSTNRSDRVYRGILTGIALGLPILILIILGVLFVGALPALKRFGPSFLWTSAWDPIAEVYGAAPMIFGTIASSLLALLIAVPLALSVAIFLTEFSPRWLRQPVAFLVELLAAIPSVVYGTWGIFVLIPFLRGHVEPARSGARHGGDTVGSGAVGGPAVRPRRLDRRCHPGPRPRAGRNDGRHDAHRESARHQHLRPAAGVHDGGGDRE